MACAPRRRACPGGGRTMVMDSVHDLPGAEADITGADLAGRLLERTMDAGVDVVAEPARAIRLGSGHPYRSTLTTPASAAPVVVIATGTSDGRLGLEGEDSSSGTVSPTAHRATPRSSPAKTWCSPETATGRSRRCSSWPSTPGGSRSWSPMSGCPVRVPAGAGSMLATTSRSSPPPGSSGWRPTATTGWLRSACPEPTANGVLRRGR